MNRRIRDPYSLSRSAGYGGVRGALAPSTRGAAYSIVQRSYCSCSMDKTLERPFLISFILVSETTPIFLTNLF